MDIDTNTFEKVINRIIDNIESNNIELNKYYLQFIITQLEGLNQNEKDINDKKIKNIKGIIKGFNCNEQPCTNRQINTLLNVLRGQPLFNNKNSKKIDILGFLNNKSNKKFDISGNVNNIQKFDDNDIITSIVYTLLTNL